MEWNAKFAYMIKLKCNNLKEMATSLGFVLRLTMPPKELLRKEHEGVKGKRKSSSPGTVSSPR